MAYILSGTIFGGIFGLLALRFVPQKFLAWVALVAGVGALVFILPVFVTMFIPGDVSFIPVMSIPLALICLLTGIGIARQGDHRWQVWLGIALGAIPILFWLAFGLGELLYPH
jgi:hypothetical protein